MNGVTSKGIFSRAESSATGLALQQLHVIAPGIELHARADRQRRDLIDLFRLQRRTRACQMRSPESRRCRDGD